MSRVSTVVLAVLVGISVFLSARLWFGIENRSALPTNSPKVKVEPKDRLDPAQLLAPARIVAHLGKDAKSGKELHTVLYPDNVDYQRVWGVSRQLILALDGTSIARPGEDFRAGMADIRQARKEPGVELILTTPLRFDVWIWAWSGQEGRNAWPITRRVILTAGKTPEAFIQIGGEESFVRVRLPEKPEALAGLLKGLAPKEGGEFAAYEELPPEIGQVAVDPGIFVPAGPIPLAPFRSVGEPLLPEMLSRTFFADISVVRRIEERDGAIIYTDGYRGLRIYPNGSAEYRAPQAGESPGPMDVRAVIERGGEFIALHGGWPPDAYLSSLTVAGDKYQLEYSYRALDLPVAGPPAPIELGLDERGVSIYLRSVRAVKERTDRPRPSITAARSVEALSAAWDKLFPGLPYASVTDVYLAYHAFPATAGADAVGTAGAGTVGTAGAGTAGAAGAGAQEEMRPTWVIVVHGARAYVDALTGAVSR